MTLSYVAGHYLIVHYAPHYLNVFAARLFLLFTTFHCVR